MVNQIGDANNVESSTVSSALTTTPVINPNPNHPVNNENARPSTTDTIAALTVAILSVIVIVTLLLLIRAIRKRRQARQGRELNAVPTISTGIMGTGVSAYSNAAMTWEPIHQDREMTVNPSNSDNS